MLLLCLAEFCVVLVTLQFSRKVVVVLGGGVDLMWEQLNSLLISLGRRVWGSYTHFDPMYGPVLWSCPGVSVLSTSLSCRLITFRICTNTMTSHLLVSSQEKRVGQYWYRTTPVIYVNNVILMLQFFLVLVTSNSNKFQYHVCVRVCVLETEVVCVHCPSLGFHTWSETLTGLPLSLQIKLPFRVWKIQLTGGNSTWSRLRCKAAAELWFIWNDDSNANFNRGI